MPITSHQVAGMIGGQQAMFGNFASYSHQISPYNAGYAPTYANPMSGAGDGFAPPPNTSHMANTMGPRATSGLASSVMPAIGMAGLAGSFLPGMAGRAFSHLDPMSAAMTGFGRGIGWSAHEGMGMMGGIGANMRRLGGLGASGLMRAGVSGLAGAAISALPIMAAGAGVKYLGGQMVEGAQFRNQVHGQLENQFRFINPNSRSGYGFTRQQSGQVSDMLQHMGAADSMTNAHELKRVMGGSIQMGLMKSVQDVKEFKDRFKKTVTALKEISKTMNTTLEGAMPFFQAARQSGFWTTTDIMRNATSARSAAQASGMSVRQVQQMQVQGTQMARSVGAMGATGARGMASSLRFVGGAVRSGVLSESEMGEATGGLTGSAAIGSMAGTLQTAATRFASSRLGRWSLAAMGSHKFKQLDPAALQRFTEGGMSIGQIGSMARRNISKQGAFNFVEGERDLRGDLLQRGPDTMLGLMRGVMGKHLYGDDARSKLITRRLAGRWFGVHGRQADLLTKMARDSQEIRRSNTSRSSSETDAQERTNEQLMEHSWEGFKRKAGTYVDKAMEQVKKAGADISTSVSEMWESAGDKFWGRSSPGKRLRGMSGQALRALQRSAMGDTHAMASTFGSSRETAQLVGVGSSNLIGNLAYKATHESSMFGPGEGMLKLSKALGAVSKYGGGSTENARLALTGSSGILTSDTLTKGLGFGSLGEGKSAIEAAGKGLKGDLAYRVFARKAHMQAGGDTELENKLLAEGIKKHKYGGEAVSNLTEGTSSGVAIARLAAAQRSGGLKQKINLSAARKTLGMSGMEMSKASLEEAEDKTKWGMAYALEGDDHSREANKEDIKHQLDEAEEQGGAEYREAMALLGGDEKEQQRGRAKLMDMVDADVFDYRAKSVVLDMINPKSPKAKAIVAAAKGFAKTARGRNTLEARETFRRRAARLRRTLGQKTESVISMLHKASGKGGDLGDAFREAMSARTPQEVQDKLRKLVTTASEGDRDSIARAVSAIERNSKGGEYLTEALRGGSRANSIVSGLSGKSGSKRTMSMNNLLRELGIKGNSGDAKAILRGDEDRVRKLTENMNPFMREKSRHILGIAGGGVQGDEEKTSITNDLLGVETSRAIGQTGATKDSIFRKQMDDTKAGDMVGKKGSLLGIHGELTRQTYLLNQMTMGHKGEEYGLNARHKTESRSE